VDVQVLSVQQVAKYLKVSGRWVRFLIESGRLQAKKVGGTWVIGGPDLYEFEKKQKGGERAK